MMERIFVLVQRDSNAKKKKVHVMAARDLEDCLPNLPLKTGKAKKKIKVLLSRQFCASLKLSEAGVKSLQRFQSVT